MSSGGALAALAMLGIGARDEAQRLLVVTAGNGGAPTMMAWRPDLDGPRCVGVGCRFGDGITVDPQPVKHLARTSGARLPCCPIPRPR